MSKEYYLYVRGQKVKVSEDIYRVYWRDGLFDVASEGLNGCGIQIRIRNRSRWIR